MRLYTDAIMSVSAFSVLPGFKVVSIVNVNLYSALSHSASDVLGAPSTAETDTPSIGDRSCRCWYLDRTDHCNLPSAFQTVRPTMANAGSPYMFSCILVTTSRQRLFRVTVALVDQYRTISSFSVMLSMLTFQMKSGEHVHQNVRIY